MKNILLRAARAALIIAIGASFMAAPAQAVIITWSGSPLIGDNANDIDTRGTLVEAHNVGSSTMALTAGGVPFDIDEPIPDTSSGNFTMASNNLNTKFITGHSNFDKILTRGIYSTSSITHNIDGLIAGRDYLLQYFLVDDQTPEIANRVTTVNDGSGEVGGVYTSSAMGEGYAFTGLFTAIADKQDVIFEVVTEVVDGKTVYKTLPIFSAWQLRDTTQNVPEPTTLALMGLGLAGIGWRRKASL